MIYYQKGFSWMKNDQLQWHPAFFAALSLELAKSRDYLDFEREHNLNVKPLEIDLLIIKKNPGISISNEIGKIFKVHNLLEYKNPKDSLDIDVFFKVIAYACLYKSYGCTIDSIKADDVTITLIRDVRPYGLFHYLKEHGYQIATLFAGIYYITGKIPFATQIVVSNELDPTLHVWLRSLSGKLKKQDIQNLFQQILQLNTKQDRENADAILEIVLRANKQTIQLLIGDEHMSNELLELLEPIIEPKIVLREQKAGIEQGIEQGIQGAADLLRDAGFNKIDIKSAIMKRYELDEKSAEKFL